MPTIRELREAKGWTQQELAEKTGLAIATISNLELGKFPPKRTTLKLIALALGTTVETITVVSEEGEQEQ